MNHRDGAEANGPLYGHMILVFDPECCGGATLCVFKVQVREVPQDRSTNPSSFRGKGESYLLLVDLKDRSVRMMNLIKNLRGPPFPPPFYPRFSATDVFVLISVEVKVVESVQKSKLDFWVVCP